jgi:hypothetical protein
MAKQSYYKQCTLTRPLEDGKQTQVAWIPEEFAVPGKKVFFGTKTQPTKEVWTVDSASDQRITGDYLSERERDHLTQRAASDI